jgi:hypothetical protein
MGDRTVRIGYLMRLPPTPYTLHRSFRPCKQDLRVHQRKPPPGTHCHGSHPDRLKYLFAAAA